MNRFATSIAISLIVIAAADAGGRRWSSGGSSGNWSSGNWSSGSCASGQCGNHQAPPAQPAPSVQDGHDALDELNARRVQCGLRPFLRDPNLTVAAQAAASYRARWRIAGHVMAGRGDFSFLPAGASAAAAGCSVRGPGEPFAACCQHENWTMAGAAKVVGPDGLEYHQLFVR